MLRARFLSTNQMRVTPQDILHGPLKETLRRMTLPMVIGIFAMMAFGAVDTFFIGLMGSQELAAISFSMPVTMVIVNLVIGLSIGTSVLVSSAIGKEGMKNAARKSTDSLLYSILIVAIVSIVGYLTVDPLFEALGATELTLPYIHQYMDIWYLCVGFMVVPIIGNSVIRATGDTKWPSILMMGSGLINVILDPIFIFGFGPVPAMGIQGAAIATAISWAAGFVGALWLLYYREHLITFSLPPIGELLRFWVTVTKIGLPISIANMMMPLAVAALTRLVSEYGELAVAGLGAGTRLESFAMVVPFAITAALSPFMAQNIGAGNMKRAHEALLECIKFIMLFQLAILVIFGGGAFWLSQIFSSDPEVVKVTRFYLWIMPLGMGFYGILIVLNTAFNAAHRADRTLLTSLIRILVFYIPLAWLGGKLLGLPGTLIGASLGNACGAAIGWYLYKHTEMKKAQAEETPSSEELPTPTV